MRLATEKDMPQLNAIAEATLKAAYPGQIEGYAGFDEQLTRKDVLVVVTDDVTAFILTERISDEEWTVRFLMPLDMGADTGRALIAAAIAEEHKQRPFIATTKCFAMLNKSSQIEMATKDAYKIIATAKETDIKDAKGVVRASELSMTAPDMIAKFKVPIVLPATPKGPKP